MELNMMLNEIPRKMAGPDPNWGKIDPKLSPC